MQTTTLLHDAVADLLTYPGPYQIDELGRRIAEVATAIPEASTHLEPLAALVAGGERGQLEETFCRTFDNSADRALEIGWQIHGENYDRGALLVRMRELMRATDVEETTELPDHLSHVLRVVGRLEPAAAHQFVVSTALPGVRKTRDGFKDEDDNPYLGVVETALLVLEKHLEPPESRDG